MVRISRICCACFFYNPSFVYLYVGTDAASGKESMPMGMNPNFDTMGADSDLAVVLNAWYAAGFYTGR